MLTQGAWACQRGVRWGDHLYLRTWHDGYHGHWPDEMLFDVAHDPHETKDLWGGGEGPASSVGASLARGVDVGPARTHRPRRPDGYGRGRREAPFTYAPTGPYLERLRSTGRGGLGADPGGSVTPASWNRPASRPRGGRLNGQSLLCLGLTLRTSRIRPAGRRQANGCRPACRRSNASCDAECASAV